VVSTDLKHSDHLQYATAAAEVATKKRRALKKRPQKILGSRNQARRLSADGAPGCAFYEMTLVAANEAEERIETARECQLLMLHDEG
jgi:hypothetical protein